MRSLSKALSAIGIVAAIALSASAADARSVARFGHSHDAVTSGAGPRTSIPYDADGPAYTAGQRGQGSSSDFQLQGQ
jgi:hypothetical protein